MKKAFEKWRNRVVPYAFFASRLFFSSFPGGSCVVSTCACKYVNCDLCSLIHTSVEGNSNRICCACFYVGVILSWLFMHTLSQ